MFGSNVNDDHNSQHNVQEQRIHNENNIICDFPANYTSQSTTSQITVCVHVAITLIYPDHNVSYSNSQSTIMTILLL